MQIEYINCPTSNCGKIIWPKYKNGDKIIPQRKWKKLWKYVIGNHNLIIIKYILCNCVVLIFKAKQFIVFFL